MVPAGANQGIGRCLVHKCLVSDFTERARAGAREERLEGRRDAVPGRDDEFAGVNQAVAALPRAA